MPPQKGAGTPSSQCGRDPWVPAQSYRPAGGELLCGPSDHTVGVVRGRQPSLTDPPGVSCCVALLTTRWVWSVVAGPVLQTRRGWAAVWPFWPHGGCGPWSPAQSYSYRPAGDALLCGPSDVAQPCPHHCHQSTYCHHTILTYPLH